MNQTSNQEAHCKLI